METATVPLFSGFMALAGDEKDPRREMMYGMIGLMGILLVLPVFGVELGAAGQAVISGFLLITGYFFGKKEEQVKATL